MSKNKTQKTNVLKAQANWFENSKIQLGILMLLGLVIYLPTINYEYTNWDDLEYITNNNLVKDFTLSKIPEIFSSYVMGNYHPLTILSFALEVNFFGESASVMHVTNFSFHILNSILLLFLLKKINLNWLFCFFPALLFLAHPLHVESVAWISERKDVLYCFFFLLSCIYYFDFKQSAKKSKYYLSILFFVFSLLSKGQAVVLPLVLICLEVIKTNKFNFKELVINKIPFFILSLVFGVIAIKAQAAVDIIGSPNKLSFVEQIVIGLNGLFFYIKSTFLPFKLSTLYSYPLTISSLFYIKALIALLLIGFVIVKFKSEKNILFSFILFFVAVFPVLQFLPVGNAVYADRYYYVPSIGLFLFLSFLLSKYAIKLKTTTLFSLTFVFCLLLSAISFSQVKVWKNSFTLWEQVRVNYPETPSAWYNTGNYFLKAKTPNYKEALPYFEKSTQLKSNYPKAYNNLGVCYYNLGDYNKALKAYKSAYSLDSNQADITLNVGKANDMLAKYDEAIMWFNKAKNLDATNDIIYYNLGISNFKKGNIDSSIYFYNSAIKLNTNNAEVYNNLGTSFIYKKEYTIALKNYNKAIQINPNYNEPYFNIALTQQVLGDTLEMIKNLKIAANLGHTQAKLYLSQYNIAF
ncbi:MAG: tetratricopeptide repeat protein [Bacteroidota bacterium]